MRRMNLDFAVCLHYDCTSVLSSPCRPKFADLLCDMVCPLSCNVCLHKFDCMITNKISSVSILMMLYYELSKVCKETVTVIKDTCITYSATTLLGKLVHSYFLIHFLILIQISTSCLVKYLLFEVEILAYSLSK